MRRIAKGPVRGISLKIQEEQREKMFDTVPDQSKVQIKETLEVEGGVLNMLKSAGYDNLVEQNLVVRKRIM